MSARHPLLRFAIVLGAWSLGGVSVVKGAGRFVAPASGVVLEGGATARIAWDLPSAREHLFDEMELVLSLDGGRTFPIRVTRDLDPAARSVSFKVPALPAQSARLALRAGDGDRPGAEQILLVSEEFAIESQPVGPLEPTEAVRGEWRTREALDGSCAAAPHAPRALGASAPFLLRFHDLPTAAAPRPRPVGAMSGPRPAALFEFRTQRPVGESLPDPPRPSADAPKRE